MYNISKKSSIKKISIILIVILIVGIVFIRNIKIENEITKGYSKIIDKKIEQYLNTTETDAFGLSPNEYATKLDLKNIDYEVAKIFKEDDLYVMEVEIYLTCNQSDNEYDISLLAHEVSWEFTELETGDGYFEVGNYKCTYSSRKKLDYMLEDMITVYVNGDKILSPQKHNTDTSDETVRCQVCGKEYKKGSDNASSISRTNMCTKCYNGYKWKQEVLDELPVD